MGVSAIRAYFELRLKLAELYPLPDDWLRVTRDATLIAGAISLQGPALTVWYGILDYALTNKLTEKLIAAVLIDNPQCKALCADYLAELAKGERPTPELPGNTTDDRVNTARGGFDAVSRQSRDIQAELAAGNGLETATTLIDTLATYKNLHDALQSFEYGISSFQALATAAGQMDTDIEQVRVLQKFLTQLRNVCQQLGQFVAALPQQPNLRDIEQAWVDQLVTASEDLRDAIGTHSDGVYDAIFDVRSVLRGIPARLDQQIFVTARSLPFGLLADGLNTIAGKLPTDDPSVAPIKDARDSIMVLASTINARVIEHQKWQKVDRILGDLTELIESVDSTTGAKANVVPQFSKQWRNLTAKVQVLSDLDPGSQWTVEIARYAIKMNDQKERETIDSAFILAFEAYRDEAQQRFVQVDLALKRECTSLVRVSEPLHRILEDLQP